MLLTTQREGKAQHQYLLINHSLLKHYLTRKGKLQYAKYIYFLLFEDIQLHMSSWTLHSLFQVTWRVTLDPGRWYLS